MALKAGDLVFVGSKGPLSKAIKIVSSGRLHNLAYVPSHVAIVASIDGESIILIEANLRKVELTNLEVYRKSKVLFARMKDPRDIEKGLEWANSQLGTGYDYTALFGILARSVFRIFGPRIYNKVRFMKNLLEKKTRFFCAEFISVYAKLTGKRLWRHHDSVTTPFDLVRSDEIYFVTE